MTFLVVLIAIVLAAMFIGSLMLWHGLIAAGLRALGVDDTPHDR